MPLLRYAQYRPDVSDYEGEATRNVLNVIPRGDGYGPFPSFSGYTSALPAACRGAFYALNSKDGSVTVFAGTSTRLYQLDNTSYVWTDVSAGGVDYARLSDTAQWQFAQFGSMVFATQANVSLQVFVLGGSSTTFGVATGSPPPAAYIAVVGRFLVLSGLLNNPYRIHWSALDDPTNWAPGSNSSDFQDFPDGGLVRGVAGGDQSGVIFQDQAIRRMAFVPGSPVIFQIDRVSQGVGLYAPYSIVRAGEKIFFYSTQGFQKIEPGGVPEPIGRERVDRTFGNDLDKANLQLFMGASDPRTTRVYWAYKSAGGMTALYDKILGYDSTLDQFFQVSNSGEYLLGLSQSGTTLEALDAVAPGAVKVTGAANNGSGLIRLAVTSTTGWSTGQIKAVSGVVGTTEANKNYTITVIDATHIDLQTSSFVNAYVSGGIVGGSLDSMVLSLDAYATAVQPEIAQFDATHTLGFFRGVNLEATMESGEQGTDENRISIRGFRPVTDAATIYGSLEYRDTQQATSIVSPETLINARTGRVDLRRDTRYARFKTRIPLGTNWTFCAGVVPDLAGGGAL
jgi:hypothetical protein